MCHELKLRGITTIPKACAFLNTQLDAPRDMESVLQNLMIPDTFPVEWTLR